MSTPSAPTRSIRRPSIFIAGVVVLFVLPPGVYLLSELSGQAGGASNGRQTDSTVTVGSTQPLRLDLGVIPRGGRASIPVFVHNPEPSPVMVAAVAASCECLRVQLADRAIGPGEAVAATVAVDMRNDPKFVGGLLLRAEGQVEGRPAGPAFVIQVGVTVE